MLQPFARVALFAVFMVIPIRSWSMPIVSFQTPSGSLKPADAFDVSIIVSGISDLYAFQFDINYASDVLAAQAVSEGSFLSSVGSTFFLPGTVGSGTVVYTVDTLLGPGAGASGTGVLAVVNFSAIGNGSSSLTFSNMFLLDSQGLEIAASAMPATITVGSGAPPSAVPEPRYLGILGILIAASLAFIKRLQQAQEAP